MWSGKTGVFRGQKGNHIGNVLREYRKFKRHFPAAYALDGWPQAGGGTVERFVFIAVEKTPPYAIGLYALSAAILDAARALIRRDLATVHDCACRQQWPGYDPAIVILPLGNPRPEPGPLFL